MLRHNLLAAARSFTRHKLYSLITVVGLSTAFACAILILLFVRYQLSYDAWIPNTSGLYRMEWTLHMIGRPPLPKATAPYPVLEDLRSKIPQVEAITYLIPHKMTVTVGNRQFLETVTSVDPNFLHVIRLPLVSGNPAQVLGQPDSLVLSQALARKFFGSADPLGKIVTVRGREAAVCDQVKLACSSGVRTLEVTGILRDLPRNTQLVANLITPVSRSERDRAAKYGGMYGYVRLNVGASPRRVLRELKPILNASFQVRVGNIVQTASQLEHIHLTRFRDVHLSGAHFGGMTPGGSWTTVYGFALIALLIVLTASANFVNLATARATLRAREVGLRRLAGATRGQLIAQFLCEAILSSMIALAVALSLVEVLLPTYDRLLAEQIGMQYLANLDLLAAIVAGAVGVGALGGVYPALALSRLRPAQALRAPGAAQSGSGLLRSALVLGQFVVSIGLAVAVIVVFRQLSFARALDLGFNRHHVVVIEGVDEMPPEAREGLMHALRGGPGIIATALSNDVPFERAHVFTGLVHGEGSAQAFGARFIDMTPAYPSLYDMRLLAGRLLSARRGQDSSSNSRVQNILINAATARRLGMRPTAAVGHVIVPGGPVVDRIVGVLADAKTQGLRTPVLPAMYFVDPGSTSYLSVRVRAGEIASALRFIDRTWQSWMPGFAIDRHLLGDTFEGQLASQERQGAVLALFMALGLFIACLGLFGLAVFTAERHTKEIGIRKVSGARTADLVRLMLWRISVPVLLANVVAWPIAYFYLHRWLQGYAYRVPLDPIDFLAAGAVALLIAWATVYANTLRLARTSPVRALRYE
jgi:putative ABC transport system permease protein